MKVNGKLGAILGKGNCGHDRETSKTLDDSVSQSKTGEIEVVDATTKYGRVGVYDPVELKSSQNYREKLEKVFPRDTNRATDNFLPHSDSGCL